jgi:hypothetical protein
LRCSFLGYRTGWAFAESSQSLFCRNLVAGGIDVMNVEWAVRVSEVRAAAGARGLVVVVSGHEVNSHQVPS